MNEETILFSPIPGCDDLFCMKCKITSLDVTDELTPSFFHCQILVCRSFLSSFHDVIAAPVPQTDNYIYVITRKECFKTIKMCQFLKMKKLWFSELQPVVYEIYKECVKYTVLFKLTPSWNKFGMFLCQGKDFLLFSEDLNAVKFDVNIKKQGMIIKFKSTKLKVNFLKVEELGLSPSLLAEFKQNPDGVIRLGRHWANVLPSLIKAKLLTVSKKIPKSCCFGNYQALRKHWKNLYGYILPERSEGILYYEVCFVAFPEQIFVYPDVCLQSEYPKMVYCQNQAPICIQFVEGLRNEVRTICGKLLSLVKFNPKDIKETPNSGFLPAKEIKVEKTNCQIPRMPLIYGIVTPKSNFTNGNISQKLKQQTLNFPRVKVEPSTPLQNLDSINSSQNKSLASKLKSPDFSRALLSQLSQSTPLKRKLIIDPKVENDISIKSKNFQNFLNLIKSNESSVRKKDETKRPLIDALLQEKPDIHFPKVRSPPTKKVRVVKSNPMPPIESVAKYFKPQKLNFDQPAVKTQRKLQLQNLLRNK